MKLISPKAVGGLVVGALCWLAAPVSSADPCEDVLEIASGEADADRASSILGACLAAPAPFGTHLQVAHALLQRSFDEDMACRYTDVLLQMLEGVALEAERSVVGMIAADAEAQACRCDRAWNRRLRLEGRDPGDVTRSWFGVDTQQVEVFSLREPVHDGVVEIFAHYRRGMDHVCAFRDEALRYAESRGAITSGIDRARVFEYGEHRELRAVLVWRRGVHGEALQLLDIEKGLPIFERQSAWPVGFSIEDNLLRYRVVKESDSGDPEVVEGTY